MRELVEDRLHEHAALRLELELTADHSVGLDPEAPELVVPLLLGSCGDAGDVDAVAGLPCGAAGGVGVQGRGIR